MYSSHTTHEFKTQMNLALNEKKNEEEGKDNTRKYMKRYFNLIVGKTFYNMTQSLQITE